MPLAQTLKAALAGCASFCCLRLDLHTHASPWASEPLYLVHWVFHVTRQIPMRPFILSCHLCLELAEYSAGNSLQTGRLPKAAEVLLTGCRVD